MYILHFEKCNEKSNISSEYLDKYFDCTITFHISERFLNNRLTGWKPTVHEPLFY